MNILTLYTMGVLMVVCSIVYNLIEKEKRIVPTMIIAALVLCILMALPRFLLFTPASF